MEIVWLCWKFWTKIPRAYFVDSALERVFPCIERVYLFQSKTRNDCWNGGKFQKQLLICYLRKKQKKQQHLKMFSLGYCWSFNLSKIGLWIQAKICMCIYPFLLLYRNVYFLWYMYTSSGASGALCLMGIPIKYSKVQSLHKPCYSKWSYGAALWELY